MVSPDCSFSCSVQTLTVGVLVRMIKLLTEFKEDKKSCSVSTGRLTVTSLKLHAVLVVFLNEWSANSRLITQLY